MSKSHTKAEYLAAGLNESEAACAYAAELSLDEAVRRFRVLRDARPGEAVRQADRPRPRDGRAPSNIAPESLGDYATQAGARIEAAATQGAELGTFPVSFAPAFAPEITDLATAPRPIPRTEAVQNLRDISEANKANAPGYENPPARGPEEVLKRPPPPPTASTTTSTADPALLPSDYAVMKATGKTREEYLASKRAAESTDAAPTSELTAADLRFCQAMGITPEKLIAARKLEQADR